METIASDCIFPVKKEIPFELDKNHQFREGFEVVGGLTKREYFAGQILIGLLANNETGSLLGHVEDAVALAHNLIKELNK